MQAILTFHSVDESGSVLSIAPAELQSLVESIRRSGHTLVGLRDMLAAPERPHQIALTFDDGMASLYDNALPLLRDLDVPASLFLTTGWLGRENGWPTNPPAAPRMPMLDWDQVGALHAAGWTIEAHTVDHPDLRDLSDAAIDDELDACDEAIVRQLGARPEGFAYPYGHHDARVEARARSRYRFAVTAGMGQLPSRIADAMCVPRLETYYFRSPRVHVGFGSGTFRAYLLARALLRRLRHAE